MSKATSVFLDLLRLIAALVVFVDHCAEFWYPDAAVFMGKMGHGAVVVFFVLSGYVITFSTLKKGLDPKRYMLGRLSRLYSVVIPALLITLFLQKLGTAWHPEFYYQHGRGHDVLRYTLAGFYLQNIWMLNASPTTNGPFWSLSYEFWYYALFGAAIFITRLRIKVASLLLISLIVGPNILLLMPCWLLGVALYVWHRKTTISFWPALIGFLLAVCGAILLVMVVPGFPYTIGSPPMFFSGSFLTDWLTAGCLAAAIWFFDAAFRSWKPPALFCETIESGASHTFSLYLYHYPLLAFAAATVSFNPLIPYQAGSVILSVLAIIFLLSLVTESQRRLLWRGLERLFGWNS